MKELIGWLQGKEACCARQPPQKRQKYILICVLKKVIHMIVAAHTKRLNYLILPAKSLYIKEIWAAVQIYTFIYNSYPCIYIFIYLHHYVLMLKKKKKTYLYSLFLIQSIFSLCFSQSELYLAWLDSVTVLLKHCRNDESCYYIINKQIWCEISKNGSLENRQSENWNKQHAESDTQGKMCVCVVWLVLRDS